MILQQLKKRSFYVKSKNKENQIKIYTLQNRLCRVIFCVDFVSN